MGTLQHDQVLLELFEQLFGVSVLCTTTERTPTESHHQHSPKQKAGTRTRERLQRFEREVV